MKVGDLVTWVSPLCEDLGPINTGIVVDGPRDGCSGAQMVNRYAVAWLETRKTLWHLDFNLEVLSASR